MLFSYNNHRLYNSCLMATYYMIDLSNDVHQEKNIKEHIIRTNFDSKCYSRQLKLMLTQLLQTDRQHIYRNTVTILRQSGIAASNSTTKLNYFNNIYEFLLL